MKIIVYYDDSIKDDIEFKKILSNKLKDFMRSCAENLTIELLNEILDDNYAITKNDIEKINEVGYCFDVESRRVTNQ